MSNRPLFVRLVAVAAVFALIVACSGGGAGEPVNQGTDRGAPSGAPPAGAAGSAMSRWATPSATDARVVIAREQRLLLRDARGVEQPLVRSAAGAYPSFPAWSPDGARIAYVNTVQFSGQPNADWGGDIYVMAAGGGETKLIWKHDQPGAQIQGMTWLPDGSGLLIGYQLTLITNGRYEGQVQRIERLDLSSGQRVPVVENGSLPSLSRDGRLMAYMQIDSAGIGGLFVSGPDGSGARRVVELGPKLLAILAPRISPDGTAVAFSAVEAKATGDPRDQHGSLRSALRALLPRPAAAHGLPMDIWKVTLGDGALTRLTHYNEDEPYSAWSSDGTLLTVIATGGLYEVGANGENPRKVGQGSFGGQVDVK